MRTSSNPRSQNIKDRPAFTLVELLVVIGIIAVLFAILLPAMQKARIQALKTQDASNLRQIAIASLMYADEYRGCLPLTGGPYHSISGFPQIWTNTLWGPWTIDADVNAVFTQRYHLEKVKQCPLFNWNRTDQRTSPFGFWLPLPYTFANDYGYVLWEGRGYRDSTQPNANIIGPQRLGRRGREILASDIVYRCINDGNSVGFGWFNPHAKWEMVNTDGSVPTCPADMHVAYTDGAVVLLSANRIAKITYGPALPWYGDADCSMLTDEGQ